MLLSTNPGVNQAPNTATVNALNAYIAAQTVPGGTLYGYQSKSQIIAWLNAGQNCASPVGPTVNTTLSVAQAQTLIAGAIDAATTNATLNPNATALTAAQTGTVAITWSTLLTLLNEMQAVLSNQVNSGLQSLPVTAHMLQVAGFAVIAGLTTQSAANSILDTTPAPISGVSATNVILAAQGVIAANQSGLFQVSDVTAWPATVTSA